MSTELYRYVADALGVPVWRVTSSSDMRDDLGADAIDIIELAIGLEHDLGAERLFAGMSRLRTVGDLCEQYCVEKNGEDKMDRASHIVYKRKACL